MEPEPVLTAAQMREVDRKTIEAGIPSAVLMENAGHRVVEFLQERYSPLASQRIAIFCGKGNNGGDGLVVARLLLTRFRPAMLDVILTEPASAFSKDADAAYRTFLACGGEVKDAVDDGTRSATLVIDAVLGTGITGEVRGAALNAINTINSFGGADVVAVDIPSGIPSDTGELPRAYVRAKATVTFTARKVSQALGPACYAMGELRVAEIGSAAVLAADHEIRLAMVTPSTFAHLLAPRVQDSNKGNFGHVLVIAGSRFKSGAAAMSGMAALRSGAGLVTVASAVSALPVIAAHAPELMTEPLSETTDGAIGDESSGAALELAQKRTVVVMGPGMGTSASTGSFVRTLFAKVTRPMVVDADALNILAESEWPHAGGLRVFTPHPGEMARLTNSTVKDVQSNRVDIARTFAASHNLILVLKGDRTLIAFPDGRVWINPTGSPAMATGGTGDILTGMIAGLLGQFPKDAEHAVAAAVYLHGLAGQKGAAEIGELPFIATDLLRYLPAAVHDCSH